MCASSFGNDTLKQVLKFIQRGYREVLVFLRDTHVFRIPKTGYEPVTKMKKKQHAKKALKPMTHNISMMSPKKPIRFLTQHTNVL